MVWNEELRYLRCTFQSQWNCYPKHLIESWCMSPNLLLFRSNRPRSEPEPEERMEEEEQHVDLSKSKNVLLVPYVKGVSDRLRNIAARYGVKLWFSFSGRLGDGFSATYKDQLHLSKSWHVVYRAVCRCRCEYIGESDRNLKVRVSEHKKPNSSSSLSKHLELAMLIL